MESILRFIQNYFNLNVLILIIVSSLFLFFLDRRGYKKEGLKKEEKFSTRIGVAFLIVGFAIYGLAKLISV